MASVYKVNATGAAAISVANGATLVIPAGQHYRLVSVTCLLNAAPTTSENFVITLDQNAGAAYDVQLYSTDLAAGSVTDLVWFPDEQLLLEGGDSIDVTYTNTDTRTYGLQITAERVM
jgi:hypothetical protein